MHQLQPNCTKSVPAVSTVYASTAWWMNVKKDLEHASADNIACDTASLQ